MKMQFIRYAVALAGMTVVVACTKTNSALMDNTVHLARTCADAVKIYTTPDKVGAPYKEIALLNSSGNSAFTSESGMMKSMRKKAASVGANGIILTNIDEPSAGAKVASAFLLGTGADRKGHSVAIYVPTDSATVRTACAGR